MASSPYWPRTRLLTWIGAIAALLLALTPAVLVGPLNAVRVLGFPLGFYWAAQGAPLALIAVLFWFARRHAALDGGPGPADSR